MPNLWAIVPAGGAGTRLWPLSRRARPKFLLDLTGTGRSLLQQTYDRLEPVVGDRVLVVTGAAHADEVRAQLPDLLSGRLLAEPSPRDSMAAIGLGAALVERLDSDAVVGSFAADHVVGDEVAWRGCVAEATAVAATDRIATIGIEPRSPATGFGYIRAGEAISGFERALVVREFVEKPDAERAAAYVASRAYRWNAGMFLARPGVLLDELARYHPDLADGLRSIAADPGSLERVWPGLTRIAIDRAVAEPAARTGLVAMVPGDFGWDDLGDFASLAAVLSGRPEGAEPARPPVLGARSLVLADDSAGLVVPRGGRVLAVLGIPDAVVVDTGDAVLVTTLEHAQQVRGLVEQLASLGREDLL